jgi:hypothetical protein
MTNIRSQFSRRTILRPPRLGAQPETVGLTRVYSVPAFDEDRCVEMHPACGYQTMTDLSLPGFLRTASILLRISLASVTGSPSRSTLYEPGARPGASWSALFTEKAAK